MANFTWEIKRELLSIPPNTEREQTAAVSAFLRTCGRAVAGAGGAGFEFSVEQERIAEYFAGIVEARFGVRTELKEAVYDPKRSRDKLTFRCVGQRAEEILEACGFYVGANGQIADGGVIGLIHGDEETLTFIRCAFLGSGSCTLPRSGSKTGYHLEVIFEDEGIAEETLELLERVEILARTVKRGEKFVVYSKSREAISDFLSLTGASSALKKLEQLTEAREESNRENRVGNCFSGNADRAAIASAKQILAITALKEKGILGRLEEPLYTLAMRRLKYPTQSLEELAAGLDISKSCCNHRMRKLMEIYKSEERGE
ncbi:MAG: DNA-binding protein WhiA [Clostridiales bacterium]|nr:DNA-binding protein WhiA [Clostridiales bacterium]